MEFPNWRDKDQIAHIAINIKRRRLLLAVRLRSDAWVGKAFKVKLPNTFGAMEVELYIPDQVHEK